MESLCAICKKHEISKTLLYRCTFALTSKTAIKAKSQKLPVLSSNQLLTSYQSQQFNIYGRRLKNPNSKAELFQSTSRLIINNNGGPSIRGTI
jgi:hypothetical protein